jgi:DNA helicase-2/ATP-dependent DNA helicase PcrA
MSDRRLLDAAIASLSSNLEQLSAVETAGHCIVLAGPGSGKTKTLTTAMARALVEEVESPRGIACITYNNECAIELEERLAKLGIEPSDRVFLGTVHSFALTQIVAPYARCVLPQLGGEIKVATIDQIRQAIEDAFAETVNDASDPHARWRFAKEKRIRQVDRTHPTWRGLNPELADFVEAYERRLHEQGLIDFDDMPLLAFRMVQQNQWIGEALQARFPVLFVDEYQDLGHALHELASKLCFENDIRLFAVGDADQSIYDFTGANPDLLLSLTQRADVTTIRLRLNYRCGTKIIGASMAALGEERDYRGPDGAEEGAVDFAPVNGGLASQASHVAQVIVPHLVASGVPLEQIAVLYRTAAQGNPIADASLAAGIPIVRADANALVKRSSKLARFLEACAKWVVGGWAKADPPFRRLAYEAVALVYGRDVSVQESDEIEGELIGFLSDALNVAHTTSSWLKAFEHEVLSKWKSRARTVTDDWSVVHEMIERTDPLTGRDLPLSHFAGKTEGTGRLNLSTLHSAKGREFDIVIMFAMNNDVLPSWRDKQRPAALREARRLFYVGVTRPRKQLILVYQSHAHSVWVSELYQRLSS